MSAGAGGSAAGELDFEHHVPAGAGDGAPVAVLLHGRGSHMGDLQSVRDGLPEGTVVVTPQAPHPGRSWGYGPGWAWYRYVAGDRLVAGTLETSLDRLHALLDRLDEILPLRPGPLFLGGFSQGGTTGLAYALRDPARLAGVLSFSGFLPADGIVDLDRAGELDVFWGHGVRDPNIPHALAERGRARLEAAGADVEARDYEIGHWIDPGELADAARWMARRVPAPAPPST